MTFDLIKRKEKKVYRSVNISIDKIDYIYFRLSLALENS